MRRAVFLDRDGVITRSLVRDGRPYAPTTMADFEVLPGVPGALENLRRAGFLNFVVTNQPDVSTGKQSAELLDEMHAQLTRELAIDGIGVCIHVDADNCNCRKPKPGMLLAAASDWNIDLRSSWMIGDRWRDIGAGQAAGSRCCFIDYGYQERRPEPPFISVGSLAEAVEAILKDHPLTNPGVQ